MSNAEIVFKMAYPFKDLLSNETMLKFQQNSFQRKLEDGVIFIQFDSFYGYRMLRYKEGAVTYLFYKHLTALKKDAENCKFPVWLICGVDRGARDKNWASIPKTFGSKTLNLSLNFSADECALMREEFTLQKKLRNDLLDLYTWFHLLITA